MGIIYNTADNTLTGVQVKALYEKQLKAFTDSLFAKLGNIQAGATDDQTAGEIKGLYEAETKAFTDALFDKLGNIQAGATNDQTGSEIRDALHTLTSPNQLDTDYVQQGSTNKYFFEAARKAMTGFTDSERSNCTLAFNDGTKVLTVTHVSDYTIYVEGVPVTITANKTKDISATIAEGWWYFYFDSAGDIQTSRTMPDFATSALITFLYWDATNSKTLGLSEERHGLIMDPKTHDNLHYQVGTRHKSGLAGTTSVVAKPTAPSSDQPSKIWLDGGIIEDEDLEVTIVNDGTPTEDFEQILGSDLTTDAAKLPIWYRSAAGVWRVDANDSDHFAFAHNGGNTLPYWNEDSGGPSWGLTAATNRDFVVYWVLVSNFFSEPVFLVPHTAVLSSLKECKALTVADIDFSDVDFPEITVLYRLSYECKTAYTNATHRCVLRDATDFRGTSVAAAAKVPGFDQAAADAWITTIDTVPGQIATDTTFYVTTTGSDTAGDGTSGNPWATVNRALEYLSNFWISPEADVTIQVADGHYTGLSSIVPNHPCGAQITITGENTHAKSMTSVESSSGAAGAWAVILNLDSVADIIVGDYVNISGAANGTKPTFITGCHEVTNVDAVNTRITVTSIHAHATPPSGAVTADVVVLKAVLDFGANTGISISNGNVINVSSLCILTTSIGIAVDGGSVLNGSGLGAAGGTFGILVQNSGGASISNCIFSGFSDGNIISWKNGQITGVLCHASGGTRGFVATVSGSIHLGAACVATGNIAQGFYAFVTGSIYAPSSISTGNTTYGYNALVTSVISAANNTVGDNGTADFSPAENTVGNEESYIDT